MKEVLEVTSTKEDFKILKIRLAAVTRSRGMLD